VSAVAAQVVNWDRSAELNDEDDQDELTGSYTLDELSDKAKEHAREKERDARADDDWWSEDVADDAVRMAGLLGIEINTHCVNTRGNHGRHKPNIYWSGFCRQGDGASFEGRYNCRPGSIGSVLAETNDPELLRLAEALTAAQVKEKMVGREPLSAVITTGSSNYSHSHTMQCDVDQDDDENVDDEHDLIAIFRAFADWIYERLKVEYDYIMSDENVDERLADFTFNEKGEVL
jgi:hypothetical protein